MQKIQSLLKVRGEVIICDEQLVVLFCIYFGKLFILKRGYNFEYIFVNISLLVEKQQQGFENGRIVLKLSLREWEELGNIEENICGFI